MKHYFIKTYGCQMNISDSERLAGVLEAAGYKSTRTQEHKSQVPEQDADIILVVTCVVRQSAEDRATGYINSLKRYKKKNPGVIIGLCGCFVTEPGKDVRKMFPHVDFFIPPNSPGELIKYLNLSFDIGHLSLSEQAKAPTAYVPIMHGCNNFCSYCIVPYVRGREKSRPIGEILEEIKHLDPKYKEIFLLGQNVNSYEYGLAKLLYSVERQLSPLHKDGEGRLEKNKAKDNQGEAGGGVARIKFVTSHPRDMSDDIIQAVKDLPRVCEYFHIPAQAGSNKVLKSMNRGYTREEYLQLVDRVRAKIPEATITSDFMVGFPGETDQDFEDTLDLFKKADLDFANTFVYSDRPPARASDLKDKVPDKIKKERLKQLNGLVKKTAYDKNQKLIGSIQEVLIDNNNEQRKPNNDSSRATQRRSLGRTRGNKIVYIKGDIPVGSIVNVKITGAQSWHLDADLTQ